MTVNSKLSQVFTYQSLVHAISGAAGGCIAMSTFYPLDTVRSRLQLEDSSEVRSTMQMIKEIVLGEGFWSLYRGLGPVLQSLSISNFVYFYTFHTLKAITANASGEGQTALKDLFLGVLAGIVNVLTTTPFWVVNTRLRMRNVIGTSSDDVHKHYKTLVGGLHYVCTHEGWRGLWSGTLPSLMLVSNPALQFMMYEMLKRNIINFTGEELSSRAYFLIGAIAKAFATLVTYPLQLVQTKQRHRSKIAAAATASTSANAKAYNNNNNKNTGMLDILFGIIRQQGFRGLFRGLEAKILQTVLTAALMFTAYEKIAKSVRLLLIP